MVFTVCHGFLPLAVQGCELNQPVISKNSHDPSGRIETRWKSKLLLPTVKFYFYIGYFNSVVLSPGCSLESLGELF